MTDELSGAAFRKATLRQVVPDELAEKLALMAHNWRRDKFTIGDIRNTLKAMVDERGLAITAPDIDDYLAESLEHEIEPRTVRYYAMIAYAFPDPLRDEYAMLSHAHFALAQSYGDKSRMVLDMARDYHLHNGKPPSCAWLQAAMSGYIYERNSGEMPPLPGLEVEWKGEHGTAYDENLAGKPAEGWLNALHRAVSFAINHLDGVTMDSETKDKLHNLLCEIDSLLSRCAYIIS